MTRRFLKVFKDLKWDINTQILVRKANARIQLLRKVAIFSNDINDLKLIYIIFIRSLLDQFCTVWQIQISQENKDDLERTQKCALKLILKEKYIDYQNAMNGLDLLSLDESQQNMCLFCKKKCWKCKNEIIS